MGTIVMLEGVRLAFFKGFKPEKVGKGDTPYYSAAFPVEVGSENMKKMEAALETEAKAKWGEKYLKIVAAIFEGNDSSYKRGPLKNSEGDVYDGFEGFYAVNASLRADKGKPLILDRVKDPNTGKVRVITDPAEGRPYNGCYVNAQVEVWAQDNESGRRINVSLKAVQFVKDGDAFGGGVPAKADDFDAIEDGADAAPMDHDDSPV